ncbi:MAG: cytochrome c biogenesis protein ResB [Opitutaceae bacterium]|nr:cytochrome c biogenesis protein ResB [Verrucomicrobiales bacterium]
MLNKILNFFTSLKLTVACLIMAVVLVFFGTLAQVKLGLYTAQEQYFRSLLVYWQPEGASWKIPFLPGGWLLGGVLLVNLIAAHIKRFELSRKKIGIFIIHGGLILLLVGQFFTELFQVESNMRLEEGESKTYSESSRQSELAVIDISSPDHDIVVSFPESMLADKGEIKHPSLPFTLKIRDYAENASPTLGRTAADGALTSSQGAGTSVGMVREKTTAKMDDRNIPAATVEIVSDQGSVGSWLVSNWLVEPPLVNIVGRQFGQKWTDAVNEPQEFKVGDKTYRLVLRPIRYYKDYTVQLLDFRHDLYIGTDKPKNFSSRVRIQNPKTGEDREVLIYMNNPLRYAGETYFQASFEPGDTVTILQVVRNPAALTPYISCTVMSVGLIIQFLSHLIKFGRRNSGQGGGSTPATSIPPARKSGRTQSSEQEVAAATTKRRNA